LRLITRFPNDRVGGLITRGMNANERGNMNIATADFVHQRMS
jgi:hypothetical protein